MEEPPSGGFFFTGLHPSFRLLAQNVSLRDARPCPELGVKPTCRSNARTSQFDPQQTIWVEMAITPGRL